MMSTRSGFTRLCLVATLLVASAGGVWGADASTAAWENTPYPYSVVSENVQDVLRNFGYNAEVRVMVAPGVTGVVQGRSGDGTARQFLDDVTKANDLDWYSDGTVVYVSPSSDEQTAVVPLNGFSFDVMKKELEEQKLFDVKFRMSKQIGGDAAIVSGPPSFVTVMKEAIEARVGNAKASARNVSRELVILRGSQSSSMQIQ